MTAGWKDEKKMGKEGEMGLRWDVRDRQTHTKSNKQTNKKKNPKGNQK